MKIDSQYEKLYGVEGYEKFKKYELLTNDDLAHSLPGQGLVTFLGLGYNTTFYSLLEQNLGKDTYESAFKLFDNYLSLIENIKERSELNAKYEKNKEIIGITVNAMESALSRIEEINISLKDLRENYPEEIEKMKELSNERKVLKERVITNDDFCQNYEQINADMKRMMNRCKENIKKSLSELKRLIKDESLSNLDKLDREDFKKKILSDFMTSSVLPDSKGDAGKDGDKVLSYGNAEYQRAKLESEYLREAVVEATALINEIDEKGDDFVVSDEQTLKEELLRAKANFSTEIARNIPVEIENENVNKYNSFLLDEFSKIQAGKDSILKQWLETGRSIYSISSDEYGLDSIGKVSDACNSRFYNDSFMKLYRKSEEINQHRKEEQENE